MFAELFRMFLDLIRWVGTNIFDNASLLIGGFKLIHWIVAVLVLVVLIKVFTSIHFTFGSPDYDKNKINKE